MNALQKLIQRRMRELGVETWSELGRRAGLPRSTVWALGTTETRRTLPKDTTLAAVATALGVTVEELRKAAYDALGVTPDVRGGPVRIVGSAFEALSQDDQDEITSLVRRIVKTIRAGRRPVFADGSRLEVEGRPI